MYFEDIIGHEKIKSHFRELLSKQCLPHSILFYGEPGLGKLTMAKALASSILKRKVFSDPPDSTYLEQSKQQRVENGESAKKVESEGLPLYIDGGDAFWLRPVKTTLLMEQWQSLLNDYLCRRTEGKRVVIVEDFQTASTVVANAMLKTIEEPAEGIYFILITTKKSTVLPTIWSRCMTVPFLPLDVQELADGLVKKGYMGNIIEASQLSQGNVHLSLTYLQEGKPPMLELACHWLEELTANRRFFSQLTLEAERLSKDEWGELMHWLRILGRDIEALRYGVDIGLLYCPTYRNKLVTLLPKWSQKALQILIAETLKSEEALRLHMRLTLIADGLLLALSMALKEDID